MRSKKQRLLRCSSLGRCDRILRRIALRSCSSSQDAVRAVNRGRSRWGDSYRLVDLSRVGVASMLWWLIALLLLAYLPLSALVLQLLLTGSFMEVRSRAHFSLAGILYVAFALVFCSMIHDLTFLMNAWERV